jgi:hypothetical protein
LGSVVRHSIQFQWVNEAFILKQRYDQRTN